MGAGNRPRHSSKAAMKRILRQTIPLVLVGVLFCYLVVSYFIAAGVTRAEVRAQEDTPDHHGLTFENVEFPSRQEGITLRGWYLPGQNATRSLIVVHGIGSVRSGNDAVDLAGYLVKRGFNVLLFDLRGHGTSSPGRISAGFFERKDVEGAFDYVVARNQSPDGIGVLGFSMGAAIAVMSAAEEPRIRAVVADSPFADASELIAQETARKTIFPEILVPAFLPGAKIIARVRYGIDVDALSPETAVKKLDYPVMVIHGARDTRIPPEHGERVYRAAKQGSSFWLVPGIDHVGAFREFPNEYVERIVRYFSQRLPAQPATSSVSTPAPVPQPRTAAVLVPAF